MQNFAFCVLSIFLDKIFRIASHRNQWRNCYCLDAHGVNKYFIDDIYILLTEEDLI